MKKSVMRQIIESKTSVKEERIRKENKFTPEILNEIEELTDSNNHVASHLLIAETMGEPHYIKVWRGISLIVEAERTIDPIYDYYNEQREKLYKGVEYFFGSEVSNEVYSKL